MYKTTIVTRTEFTLLRKNADVANKALAPWRFTSKSHSGNPQHEIVSILNNAANFGVGVNKTTEDIIAIWSKSSQFDVNSLTRVFRVFKAIEKYVEAGSFIELADTEIGLYRWSFIGDYIVTKIPKGTEFVEPPKPKKKKEEQFFRRSRMPSIWL